MGTVAMQKRAGVSPFSAACKEEGYECRRPGDTHANASEHTGADGQLFPREAQSPRQCECEAKEG